MCQALCQSLSTMEEKIKQAPCPHGALSLVEEDRPSKTHEIPT